MALSTQELPRPICISLQLRVSAVVSVVVVADDIVVVATALVWLLKYLRACRWLHLIVQGGTGCKRQMQVQVARKKRSRAK